MLSPKTAMDLKSFLHVRKLRDEFVCNVTNEFMKLIF